MIEREGELRYAATLPPSQNVILFWKPCRLTKGRARMNDKAFNELQLRMTILPHQVRWPAPEHVHWQRLHEAANEARERVSKAYTQMDEIDRDA